jgi:hypothetical protein
MDMVQGDQQAETEIDLQDIALEWSTSAGDSQTAAVPEQTTSGVATATLAVPDNGPQTPVAPTSTPLPWGFTPEELQERLDAFRAGSRGASRLMMNMLRDLEPFIGVKGEVGQSRIPQPL